jgi:Secretion system C-terminal sorting domain
LMIAKTRTQIKISSLMYYIPIKNKLHMKKIIITLMTIAISNILFAQKSTGVVRLGDKITAKIDLNTTTSIVTLTMTGPSDRWFGLGLGTLTMKKDNGDVLIMQQTRLSDRSLTLVADTPMLDPIQNWTLASNTVAGSVRTIKATRTFNGDGVKDFKFTAAMTSINLIWAYCDLNSFEPTFAARHGELGCGSKTALFSGTLGLDDFISIDNVTVYPNPSKGTFKITKNENIVSSIKIFDTTAKLIKEVQADLNAMIINVDLSGLPIGNYFMEIANQDDKIVKKIIID